MKRKKKLGEDIGERVKGREKEKKGGEGRGKKG